MESVVPIVAAVVLLLLVYVGTRQYSSGNTHTTLPIQEHVTYAGKLWVRTEPGASGDVARKIREVLELRLLDVSNISANEVAVSNMYPNKACLTSAIERIEQIPEVVIVQTHNISPRYDYARDENRKIVRQGG